VPDEAERPTESGSRKVHVSWHDAEPVNVESVTQDGANYTRYAFKLPISYTHAKALEDGLQEYKQRCVAVIDALDVKNDDGHAYRAASAAKHAQFNHLIGLMEGILAYIGVYAKR